ncbi:MAG: hypothetical protein EPO45_12660 [Sphingobium sp.]|jgi:hypothetical protein|uniref:Uncharacterized protein n=1 Tax=Sphingobium xenophagum TaxID=121428 RepID=A0A249MXJ4_SPHXE|nr:MULTISPECIES: hypothetical protein [Sphingobium]MBU0660253.1 hypothetical protein [Alphaproteobacteria bacterium]ASY46058.1 hypothetical protein CJD35_16270 [Sphingobium xenophagum]MBA4756209.1 hypothetical protein [Sphingobium sp.]MBS91214.1 hypothetical protein [Sphingobium sp.]MBU0776006.1 hypothetical protein [Alphaproteobacteria bacterium]|tara:strand:- start:145 stop:558 length:414 start_codon:yes stop_codon:yes gene_type:complete
MPALRFSLHARLVALLCIALLALFAGMGLSRMIDKVQHAPGAAQAHGHLLLSALTVEEAHDADHDVNGEQDEGQSDRLPDSHHHHGDSGSGIILLTQAGLAAPSSRFAPPAMMIDQVEPDSAFQGQERPPRLFAFRV